MVAKAKALVLVLALGGLVEHWINNESLGEVVAAREFVRNVRGLFANAKDE
jgi:hypothetical protein